MIPLFFALACGQGAPVGDGGGADGGGADGGGTATTDGGGTATTDGGGAATSDGGGASTDTGGDTGTIPSLSLELTINEFMASNGASLRLEDGSSPDWVELYNPGSEAVDLTGWSLSDDGEQPRKHVLGAGLRVEPGGFLLLYADDLAGAGLTHLGFKLAASGGELGLYAPDGRGQLLRYGAQQTDFSVARIPDGCVGEGCWQAVFRGTPGSSNQPVEAVWSELVALDATWRYLDGGVDPGASFIRADFDDSGWAAGPAPLGFGDAHIATTVSSGGSPIHTTTWFRHAFTLEEGAAPSGLRVELMVDDGARVWLNGEELLRQNLPDGEIGASTFALTGISDSSETALTAWSLDADLLVEGDNQLAVDVHQATSTSSDLGFALRLSVLR